MKKRNQQTVFVLGISCSMILFALINFSDSLPIPWIKGVDEVLVEKQTMTSRDAFKTKLEKNEKMARDKLKNMEADLKEKKKEFSLVKDEIRNLEDKVLVEQKGALHIPSLMIELEQKAKRQHISISFNVQDLQSPKPPEAPEAAGSNTVQARETLVNIKFNGKYQSIIQYIRELETFNSFISVKALEFERKQDIMDGILTIAVTHFGT